MFRIVLVTAPNGEAEALARKVVTARLAACASLIPGLRSIYWWQGKMESAAETLIVFKCPARSVRPLMRRVKALHSYEVPEIVALPVDSAWPAYAAWVKEEARPTARSSRPRRRRARRLGQ